MTATITATATRIHETTNATRPAACTQAHSNTTGPEVSRPRAGFFFTLLRALACVAA